MAKIHVLLSGQEAGTYPMNSTPCVVGRHGTCHVQIDNASLSRRHCQFTYEDGVYYVQDMMSSNGTFIEGKRIRRASVENGVQISVGKYVLLFEDSGLELPPGGGQSVAKPAGGALGFSGAQKTFQMDAAALQQQMAKAGTAATSASTEVVQRAADVAKRFDPDRPVEVRERKRIGKYVAAALVLLGVGVLASLVVLAFYMVMAD